MQYDVNVSKSQGSKSCSEPELDGLAVFLHEGRLPNEETVCHQYFVLTLSSITVQDSVGSVLL
jgi:hypothetical protein